MTQKQIQIEGPKGILLLPNANFLKSEEGIKEYQKVGLPYPNNYRDTGYEQFLQQTPEGPGNEFCHQNRKRVESIYRVRLAEGKEFLVWTEAELRYTPLGNPLRKARSNLGLYPILEVTKQVRIDSKTGYRSVVDVATGVVKTGYSLEYNLKNIDELHKHANDRFEYDLELGEVNGQIKPTGYYVKDIGNKIPIRVRNWEDFRTGDFDELHEYGKEVTSKKERKELDDKIENANLEKEKESVIAMIEDRKKQIHDSRSVGDELSRKWKQNKSAIKRKIKEMPDLNDQIENALLEKKKEKEDVGEQKKIHSKKHLPEHYPSYGPDNDSKNWNSVK